MATYNQDDIIRYVENELSPEERQKMDADLRQDAGLAAGISLYRELRATLAQRLPGDAGRDALLQTLGAMDKRYFKDEKRRKIIPMRRWVAGIAAAASVIIATVLLWPSGNGDYLQRLGHTQMIGTGERGSDADSLLQQAAGYFNKEDFAGALPLLNRAYAADSSSQLALFYRGVAQWHTGAIDAARKDLQQVYTAGSVLQYEAALYMALTFAGQHNQAAAKEWLQKIPDDAPVADKARELRKKLE